MHRKRRDGKQAVEHRENEYTLEVFVHCALSCAPVRAHRCVELWKDLSLGEQFSTPGNDAV